MKIIDKFKDFYDWVGPAIYGIDDNVIYDRRKKSYYFGDQDYFNALILPKERKKENFDIPYIEDIFLKNIFNNVFSNSKGIAYDSLSAQAVPFHVSPFYNKEYKEGVCYAFFLLEAGTDHYYFEIKLDNNNKDVTACLIDKKEHCKHLSKAPLALINIVSRGYYIPKNKGNLDGTVFFIPNPKIMLDNPFLAGSIFVKHLNAEDIWNAVYSWLSSKNEKEITDDRTDKLKIESAGFDSKRSFRPKMKK